MSDTIKLADKSNSSLHWTPEEMLEQALKDIRTGKAPKPNKAVLVLSKFQDGNSMSSPDYYDGYYAGTNDLEANGLIATMLPLRVKTMIGG